MGAKQAALAGAGVATVFLAVKLLKKRFFDDKYGGLDSAVSYSAKKIAAARAMEAEEEKPLVLDPLAAGLAGPAALAAARRRQQPAPPGSDRKIKVNMMAIRTRWFDDALEAALGMPLPSVANGTEYVAAPPPDAPAPRQCVVLGAGMDSRAWRLKLPASLRWFEVDRGDVIAAKEALLGTLGAEFEITSPMSRSQSVNARLEAKIGRLDHHSVAVQHPLRTYSRQAVPADLGTPEWRQALLDAGFDAGKPTVWLAEGLLMYLEPARVSALLEELAGLSARGSMLLTVSVTEEVVSDIQAKGTASELMKEWKFGCPADPRGWLQGLGWEARVVGTRASLAAALGLAPELCAFEADPESSKDGRSLFIAAALA